MCLTAIAEYYDDSCTQQNTAHGKNMPHNNNLLDWHIGIENQDRYNRLFHCLSKLLEW